MRSEEEITTDSLLDNKEKRRPMNFGVHGQPIQRLPENAKCYEKDPNGIDQHSEGAKLDSGKNRLGLVLGGFSKALQAVGEVGTLGANKYSDNGWMDVENGVNRYTDAMMRHLFKELAGEKIDQELQVMHAAQTAWNALSRLELMLRGQE